MEAGVGNPGQEHFWRQMEKILEYTHTRHEHGANVPVRLVICAMDGEEWDFYCAQMKKVEEDLAKKRKALELLRP